MQGSGAEQTFATLRAWPSSNAPSWVGASPRSIAGAAFERLHLDDRSWVDVARDWLRGADTLFDALVETVPWTQGKRWMYERMVDDPRLSCWFPPSEPLPHPALAAVKLELERRYDVPFGSVGLNYYRDGNDSVAWHCDRELREREDTRIAILTLGSRRPFLLRPRGGGHSRNLMPGAGDLLVMGGRCQMDWEHNVPKVRSARAAHLVLVAVDASGRTGFVAMRER